MENAVQLLENLSTAKQMTADGKDAKAIKLATGWEPGGDGKWRMEMLQERHAPLQLCRRHRFRLPGRDLRRLPRRLMNISEFLRSRAEKEVQG